MFEFTPVGSLGLTIAGLFRFGTAGLFGVGFCCDFCTESLFTVVLDGNEDCATADVLANTNTALIISGSDILLD